MTQKKKNAPKGAQSNRKSRKGASIVNNPETRTPCEECGNFIFATFGTEARLDIVRLDERFPGVHDAIPEDPEERYTLAVNIEWGDPVTVFCGNSEEADGPFFAMFSGHIPGLPNLEPFWKVAKSA